ncbi:MAG: 30S ribosomal protein S11 [Candidatus Komeilibacteria bacterium RIFCSPLOWO2_01_FULL_45_10]|uniref:Small ribosomal subunit protein uS11 n=1 Tax=Candidatus Komeilibacteria bacterium RIFCSPLOWO2_01_FULL_45_10 TaxID=1798550 RepID=A0A1G2BHI4_9BACT|nr:MAG: 30S ribosomal protein S11 [Candidatus Komeilibacteria bacterium RIFCSPLOWO2_01_FULL_45_10]
MAEEQPVIAKKKKKKIKRIVKRGQAHILATYNNTIVTITDQNGNAVAASSSGRCGFKGPKKATPYASGMIIKSLLDKIRECQMQEVDVFVKGVGAGREAAIRALHANGLTVLSIKDITPIPHNGCRPPKVRRV